MLKYINKSSLSDEKKFIKEGGLRINGILKKDLPEKPLFSLITVVKNSSKTIERTIKSVLEQSYKNIEYIIIDGASTDGTDLIIDKYKDSIDYWCKIDDEGLYHAMNYGIISSSGSIIGIINSDDIYKKDAIETINRCFEKQNDCSFVFGTVERHYLGNNKIIKSGFDKKRIKYNFDAQSSHSTGFFIKSEAQKKLGLYNTNYRCSADYDLFYKLIITNKMQGLSTKSSEIIGVVSSGGFSSKFGFWNHLKEETKIRLMNKQNRLLISLIFINAILKYYIKKFLKD